MLRIGIYADGNDGNRTNEKNSNKIEISPFHIHTMVKVTLTYANGRGVYMKNIILTGDRPSGKLHIGHYVGSLKRRVELQNSGKFDKIYVMIADAQALTDNFDNPDKVRSNITEVALDYMACGIDPAKSTIFVQSHVAELTELTF